MTILSSFFSTLPIASDSAQNYQDFFVFLLAVSLVLFLAVLGSGLFFVVKYRRRSESDTVAYIPNNHWLEWGSMFVIGLIAAITFFWGLRDYIKNITPKMNEYEINILARQWSWEMQYANGKILANTLYVPKGKDIKLIMTSKDVLHSFFVPAFRIKQDVVPGLFTTLRFRPTRIGEYIIYCAEYCGTSHSMMLGKVHVLEPENFRRWEQNLYAPKTSENSKTPTTAAKTKPPNVLTIAQRGAILYKTKTCNVCHSINGSRLVGPTFKGAFNRITELSNGKKVTVDENYIRRSLMDPMKEVVKGYPASMPTFRGTLTDEEVNELIAYIKTLK